MNASRTAAAIFAVFFAGFFSPADAAARKIRWFLGHPNLDYFEEAAVNFKNAVEKGTKGELEIEIVTSATDGVSRGIAAPQAGDIAGMVARGEAEMGHSFTDVMGAVDPKLYAFEAPYLFRDYRHMEGVFEGPLGVELLDGLRKHDLVGLSFTYSGGPSHVATTGRELRRPEDLKDLKVGVYGDAVNEAWLKSLGATPVAIEHRSDSILPLAKDGKLDAVVITWRNFERAMLHRQFSRMSLPGSTFLVSVTYANQKFFDSLPAAHRALLLEASQEAGRIERAKTLELNESAKREMLAKGVKAVHLTPAARGRFASALKPSYEDAIEKIVGKDFLERVKATGDGPGHPSRAAYFAGR